MFKRIQFIELQDLAWIPSALRDGVTDYLQFLLKVFKVYAPAEEIIKKINKSTKSNQILDLCSGSGGPLVGMSHSLKDYKITLSDLYPNYKTWKFLKKNYSNIDYINASTNAFNTKIEKDTIVTMFTSFHHFDDEGAKKIIKNCIQEKSSIAVFEFVQRDLLSLLLVIPSPLFMFFLIPFVTPFSLSRLFFTYIIPLIPFITFWDIIVTVLRIRNENELRSLVPENQNYNFVYGEKKTSLFLKVSYFYGVPNNE
jgi:hypothetical protein